SFNIFERDRIIGRVGLHYIQKPNQTANIGYWLVANQQGKGIVTKAVKRVMKIGFEDLSLNRLEIKAAVQNIRSRAIPERLGFRLEGILRQAEVVQDAFYDQALYSFLKDELQQ
ncbi:MAG TPA: GNAT family protein, partial [Niabella sp.]|nr:GNAT family protein [Niabella sp.]